MRRVIQVAYIYLQTINSIIHYFFVQFLCNTYQLHLEPAKKSQKANLSRLVKPADF